MSAFCLPFPEFPMPWAGAVLTVTMTGPPILNCIFVNGEPLPSYPEPLRFAVALQCARLAAQRRALWCGEIAFRRIRRVPLSTRGDAA